MTQRLAIGIGCRRNCSGEAVAALVRRALMLVEVEVACGRGATPRLFTSEAKADEPGLAEAAAALGLPLIGLPQAELEAAAARCETRSERVQALFGLPSLAEAAALAGAGRDSLLVLKRISENGASCAVALRAEATP